MRGLINIWKTSGLVWLWITALVVVIDRLFKYEVMVNLVPYKPQPILPFFNLTLVYNTGAAFSFLHNASGWQNIFFGGLAVVVGIVILIWLGRSPRQDIGSNIALCFVLGGALSNLWDRMAYGFVIDYLDFHLQGWHFAIFNIADSAIFIGAVLLFLTWTWPFKSI